MDQHHITRNMAAKGFQIFDIATSKKLSSAVAQFKYKGFIVSFCTNALLYSRQRSGQNRWLHSVLVKSDTCSMSKDDLAFETVEDAISAIDAYHEAQKKLDY